VQEAARVLGVQIVVFNASTISEINAAFAASTPTPSSSPPIHFFSAVAFNLPFSRRATGCLRVMARVNMSKLAG
jgi:hypothetical protein